VVIDKDGSVRFPEQLEIKSGLSHKDKKYFGKYV